MKRRAALPPAALPRQRGATLISLMVGLVISMLVTVATLMLYKNLVRATGDSRVNAQFDAQRSAALLMSGMTLQDAGFGIDDPQVGEHLITLKGATLGNDVNLRDVEGRSALLLGKAKDNNASAAIGPFIRLFDSGDAL